MYKLISIIAVGMTVIVLLIRWQSSDRKPPKGSIYPRNPPTRPIVGNALDLDSSGRRPFFAQFTKWYEQIPEPIYRFSAFGQWIYVLNTEKAAHDLLNLNSATNSSRSRIPSVGQLLCKDLPLILLPYDTKRHPEASELWRRQRKFLHLHLSTDALKKHSFIHEIESTKLVRDLGSNPREYPWLLERFSSSILFRLAFGMSVSTGQEEVFKEGKHHLTTFMNGFQPGAYLVDTFPSMMMLPEWIAPWKKYLRKEGDRFIEWCVEMLDDVNARFKDKNAPHTLATDYLTDQGNAGFPYLDAAVLVSTTYSAGGPPTASACEIVLLAMLHHPEWQKKLQQELDRVIGSQKMPTLDDIEKLPVLRAIVKEALRWRPQAVAPHTTTEDTVYEGYFIPEGSQILVNRWSMLRDPMMYPDGNAFNPDRWLSPSYPTYKEPLSKYPNIQLFSIFGYGRRICPGQYLAERSVYIAISRIFWAYDLSKSVGPGGKEIPVPWNDFEMPIFRPKTFRFDVKLREAERANLIDEALESLQAEEPLKNDMRAAT